MTPWRVARALAVFGVASLLVGCVPSVPILEDRSGGLFLMNVSDHGVGGVWYEAPAGEVRLFGAIEPGGAGTITEDVFEGTGGCSVGDLVARDSTGTEIARRHDRICHGETWLIQAAKPSARP